MRRGRRLGGVVVTLAAAWGLAQVDRALALPDLWTVASAFSGRLAAIDTDELREVLIEAWRARAPRRLLSAYDATHGVADSE